MKKIFALSVAILSFGLLMVATPAGAHSSVGVFCWELLVPDPTDPTAQVPIGEVVCFDVVDHDIAFGLTGVLWVHPMCDPSGSDCPPAGEPPPPDACIPVDGAAVFNPGPDGPEVVLEFTRMIGPADPADPTMHGNVHHTVARIDPSPGVLSGMWEDQHGAGGAFVFRGGPSPENPCLHPQM